MLLDSISHFLALPRRAARVRATRQEPQARQHRGRGRGSRRRGGRRRNRARVRVVRRRQSLAWSWYAVAVGLNVPADRRPQDDLDRLGGPGGQVADRPLPRRAVELGRWEDTNVIPPKFT